MIDNLFSSSLCLLSGSIVVSYWWQYVQNGKNVGYFVYRKILWIAAAFLRAMENWEKRGQQSVRSARALPEAELRCGISVHVCNGSARTQQCGCITDCRSEASSRRTVPCFHRLLAPRWSEQWEWGALGAGQRGTNRPSWLHWELIVPTSTTAAGVQAQPRYHEITGRIG